MPIWLEELINTVLGATLNRFFDEKGTYPIIHAMVNVIPFCGGVSQGMVGQSFGKFLLAFLSEMGACVLLPIPPVPPLWAIVKIVYVIDGYVIARRVKSGKKVGDWEWFWN
jgi:hypothetical protein